MSTVPWAEPTAGASTKSTGVRPGWVSTSFVSPAIGRAAHHDAKSWAASRKAPVASQSAAKAGDRQTMVVYSLSTGSTSVSSSGAPGPAAMKHRKWKPRR